MKIRINSNVLAQEGCPSKSKTCGAEFNAILPSIAVCNPFGLKEA